MAIQIAFGGTGRISLSTAASLPDALSKNDFTFRTGAIPSEFRDAKLFIKCQSIEFPAVGVDTVEVNLYGHTVVHRGKRTPINSVRATYMEDANGFTMKTLRSWVNTVANAEDGNSVGVDKLDYSVNSEIQVFNNQGAIVHSIALINMWPTQVEGFELEGGASSPLLINVTFAFDHIVEGGKYSYLNTVIGSVAGAAKIRNSITPDGLNGSIYMPSNFAGGLIEPGIPVVSVVNNARVGQLIGSLLGG